MANGDFKQNGKSITSFKYERVKGFYNGMAAVSYKCVLARDTSTTTGRVARSTDVVASVWIFHGIAQVEIASTGRKCFNDNQKASKESESSAGKTVKT